MRPVVIYMYRGQYAMLECVSEEEGLEILSDLATHEKVDPVGVYNPTIQRITWHPENPFRQWQESDPKLKKSLHFAKLFQLIMDSSSYN